ncbi:hypothetical protein, partial [Bifidobacterium pseudocatenulatum]|uniref:hypothetical protein n=1 Tax=Bifidobacterium pseudocatenulatum TaxID=28026 RepID=UPI001EDB2CB1
LWPYLTQKENSYLRCVIELDLNNKEIAERWQTVNNAMLDRLVDLSRQHHTGLVPDFAWITRNSAKPVKPKTISTKQDGS